ncbi:hypothetical protein OBBRIDRAFT_762524 [Obba rivulosa]|uniref:Peroxisomal membrane protein PEX17 n=1 Tax=Obba rivulosa TaxID=1052685 RepID=A0A8E2ALY1_9APHY|nr:hypothetical protein OBBRIDRAFT_762524 [Obba rivulosa]
MDRGYFYLLSHLHRPATTLPLNTLQASIAHYLAHLQPSPTSLAGTLVSSPLFRVLLYPRLDTLCTALRHALHIKAKLLKDEQGIFVRSVNARAADWVKHVLEGFRGGHPVMRLVCAGGLLLGLEDLEGELHAKEGRMRARVEEEVVLALAEVIDTYTVQSSTGWEKDFSLEYKEGEDPLSLALLVASRFVPLVAARRLQALPLPILSDLLLSTIESTFDKGDFLVDLPMSSLKDRDGKLTIRPGSRSSLTVERLKSSHYLSAMALLSKTTALALSVLAESRPSHGWPAMGEAAQRLEALTRKVEAGWVRSPLAAVTYEGRIAPQSQELTKTLWTILKTLLFTTIMVSQSILSVAAFNRQPLAASDSPLSPSPFSLALTVLHTLSHLSFVISQFGSVTSTAQSSFPELKRVFYMALDILSASAEDSERFVSELCGSFREEAFSAIPVPVLYAKKAYALASIEQLVPVLGDESIRTNVFPLCLPHLSDPTHRETYESSHSVLLAIFAAHAQKAIQRAQGSSTMSDDASGPAFAEQIVPFYTHCLIENSGNGKLSTVQLRLAYAALVRSAGTLGGIASSAGSKGETMACFCIDTLLKAIDSVENAALTQPSSSSTPPSPAQISEHAHRLHLALIATIPSLPLLLLPRVLDEVRVIAERYPPPAADASDEPRAELVDALFKELSENIGDEAKPLAMRWWYDNRRALAGLQAPKARLGDADGPQLIARL